MQPSHPEVLLVLVLKFLKIAPPHPISTHQSWLKAFFAFIGTVSFGSVISPGEHRHSGVDKKAATIVIPDQHVIYLSITSLSGFDQCPFLQTDLRLVGILAPSNRFRIPMVYLREYPSSSFRRWC